MKFLYCPECGNIRPRGWIIWTKRCEICGADMTIIKTKMTWITPIYYASLVVTVVILAIYLINLEVPYGNITLIISVAITMILAFADYTKSYYIARKMIPESKKMREK